jgi:hypothetical protein
MAEWGPWFDFGAVVLPTLLAIAGVIVTVEAPKIESRNARWGWRIGLLVFGLLVSLVTYEQQKLSREEATNQAEMNYVPSLALTYSGDKFNIENHGKSDLLFWGNKLNELKDIEPALRIIAVGSSYYILTDPFKQYVVQTVGENGEARMPFELYLSNTKGREFIATFILWVVVKNKDVTVHTQMTGLDQSNWKKR